MNDTFVCDTCGCIDQLELAGITNPCGNLQCTQCASGTWHDLFPRRQYNPTTDLVVNRPNGIGIG